MDILSPTSLDEVRDIIRNCLSDETSLSISGTGTKSSLGNPVFADAHMQLSGMSGIITYEPEELILVARAGTELTEIEALLEAHNQMLSFEPFHPETLYGGTSSGTIGGMVGAGLSGPRRIASGGVRDYLLGFNAVSGRGDIFQSGSRVMKNVTGYDLSKLMAGSFGTLAIMDEIAIKVLPAPETSVSLVVSCSDLASAQAACSQAFASAHEPTAACILPRDIAANVNLGGDAFAAVIRLEGVEVSVANRLTEMQNLLGPIGELHSLTQELSANLWRQVRDAAFFNETHEQIWKLSVAPTACVEIMNKIRTSINASYFMDWAGGLIWLAGAGERLGADIRDVMASNGGGHATLMRASDDRRQNISIFQPQAPALMALHTRIRRAFDPKQLLNPGRMGA